MVRSGAKSKLGFNFLCMLAFAFASACTQKPGTSNVSITMPTFSKSSSSKIQSNVSAQSTNASGEAASWGLADPTQISDFGCFGVFVGGPDSGLDAGQAFDTSGALVFKFGVMAGLVPPGGTISLQVPSGNDRLISVVGLGLVAGASCEHIDMLNHEITDSLYSAPFLLGQSRTNLTTGDNPPISILVTFNSASPKIDNVNFPTGGGGNRGSGAIYLGSGADGDITFTQSGLVDLSTIPIPSTSRKLTTTRRVDQLSLTGTPGIFEVRLFDPAIGVNEFKTGDEVMLYVAADSPALGPPPLVGGCQQLFSGFRIPGHVTVDAGSGVFNAKFDDNRVASIAMPTNSASYGSANPLEQDPFVGNATPFCTVLLTRVPNIRNLTLSLTGGYLTVPPLGSLSAPSNNGGILALRVQQKLLVTTANNRIDVSGLGYVGGAGMSKPGESASGYTNSAALAANFSGGGGASYSAPIAMFPGGGGHGNPGLPGLTLNGASITGDSSNGGFSIGDQYGCGDSTYDGTAPCLFGKLFFGGGGGTSYMATGGNGHGGGILMLFANQLEVQPGTTLGLSSNGLYDSMYSASDGGGAGGAILLRTNDLRVDGQLIMKARGGDSGDSSQAKPGAGAGGRIHVDVAINCVAPGGALTVDLLGGTSGVSYGGSRQANAGTKRYSGGARSQPNCVLP